MILIIVLLAVVVSFIIVYPFWKDRQREIRENDKKGIPSPPLR